MTAEIIVTSGGVMVMTWQQFISQKQYENIAKRAYETEDSVLYGNWATAIRAKRGGLEKFIGKTPQTAALMVFAEIDLDMSDFLADKKTEDILKRKREVGEYVAGVFERNRIGDEYGIEILPPKLFDLDLGQKSRDAAENVFVARKFTEAVKEMKKVIKDGEKAGNTVLVATGVAKKTIFEVQGLEGALKSAAGAAEAFFKRNS
jgi:hypothetical protein